MAEELQYTLTFKSRAEGDAAGKMAADLKEVAAQTQRVNALQAGDKVRTQTIAYYDLGEAIRSETQAVKAETTATTENDVQRAKAMQTVRQIRAELEAEEAVKRQAVTTNTSAGMSFKNFGSKAGMAAFQIQDIAIQMQAGIDTTTVMAQQLPQLLMIFGPQGAIAGGVIAVGALAYKMATASANTKEATERAEEYRKKLKDLQELKADEKVQAMADALERATQQQDFLNQAEVRQIAVAASVADGQRKVADAHDEATEAGLRYLEAVQGIDTSEQLRTLNAARAARDRAGAIAAETVKIEQQQKALDQWMEKIEAARVELETMKSDRDKLSTDLSAADHNLTSARVYKNDAAAADFQQQVVDLQKQVQALDSKIPNFENSISAMYDQAYQAGVNLDQVTAEASARIRIINAQADSKASSETLSAAIDENKNLVGTLKGAVDVFGQQNSQIAQDLGAAVSKLQTQTPAQAAAVAQIQAAVADGELSAADMKASSDALRVLMATMTTGQQELTAAASALNQQSPAQAEAIATLRAAAEDGRVTAEELRGSAAALQLLQGVLKAGQQELRQMVQALINLMQQQQRETSTLRAQIQQVGAVNGQ